jgi:outer membrane protein OmpA-like peptidoglycan-associated protein
MLAAVRRIALSLPSLIVAGLVAAYLLFGWFGFEPLARWLAPKFVADQSAHRLTIERARFDPLRLTLRLGGVQLAEPDGKPLLAFNEMLVDFQFASLFRAAYTFKEVRLSEPDVQIRIDGDGRLNWMPLVRAFTGAPRAEPADERGGLPRFLIEHAVLHKGRVSLEDQRVAGGFRTVAEPLDLELNDLSTLPQDKGDHVVSVRTSFGAQVRWKGELGLNPLVAHGDVAIDELQLARIAPLLRGPLQMAPPEGQLGLRFAYRVSQQQGQLTAQVEQFGLDLQKLTLRGAHEREATVVLDKVALSGGRFDWAARSAALDAITIDGGRVALQRLADGLLNVQQWMPAAARDTGAAATAAPPSATGEDKPWRFAIGRIALDGVACHVLDQTFEAPLAAEVGRVQLAFKADGEFGSGAPKLNVTDFGADMQALRVTSAEQKGALLEIDRVSLHGGKVDLAAHSATLGKVALTGAKTVVTRDARGELSLLAALRPARAAPVARTDDAAPATPANNAAPATPANNAAPAAPSSRAAATPWRYRIDTIEADGAQVALRDESVQPAFGLTLHQIQAEARDFSDDASAALPVRLRLQVREGGRLEAQGQVVRATQAADLRVKLDALALQPAQGFVAQAAHLTLAGGRASSAGRVRVQGGKLRYDGGFDVKDLLINESASGERFIAWQSLGTSRLVATTERLDIDELRVVGLGAKLLIDKDRTINVAKIMKARDSEPAAPARSEPAPSARATARSTSTPTSAPSNAAPAYAVKIARVRVSDGDVDFADLSLALPFGARIHALQGQLVGLSNAPGAAAQLELQGQVDEYGLSRAAGQINLFEPTAFTDIRVTFQNVEMTRLTPYSATFAGRKIASGKLSLDLEYKVKARQLQGDNKVVMDQLTLGERVESPNAADLPLDLAVAILQDENGKIDLGLPVSGSLDDPQFNVAGIVWRALTNVLTRVASAPFRALGALFGGGGDEQSAKVVFDAGAAELLPPERDKVKKLAQAVAKRPRLSLAVHAAFDPNTDGVALKEQSLRRALAAQMRREVAGDDLGAIAADPAARDAIEALYVKRFGAPALQQLQGRHQQANPAPLPADAAGRIAQRLGNLLKPTPPPLSAEETAQLKGADLHLRLLERLRDAETVSVEQLRALGASRAQAISRELIADGVASDRIEVAEPNAADVAATISLGAKPKAERPVGATPTARARVAVR